MLFAVEAVMVAVWALGLLWPLLKEVWDDAW